jgi:hypothetical protein
MSNVNRPIDRGIPDWVYTAGDFDRFFIDRRSGILTAPRSASPDVENQVGMSTIFRAAKKRLLIGCGSAFFAVFCTPLMKRR